MSEDTLNEKLYETIFDNLDSFENHISGIEKAANECERICILEQIFVLKKLHELFLGTTKVTVFEKLEEELQSLTNKLNSLKS